MGKNLGTGPDSGCRVEEGKKGKERGKGNK